MGPEFKTRKKKNASIMGNVLPPNNSVVNKSGASTVVGCN